MPSSHPSHVPHAKASSTAPRLAPLNAARLGGSCALGIIGQVAVDMPTGYFGGADHVTPWGALWAAMLVLVATLTAWTALRAEPGRSWALFPWLTPLVPAVSVGVFVPAAISDPMVAGGVASWNLFLLAQLFLPIAAAHRPRTLTAQEELRRLTPAIRHLAAVSLTLTVAVVGYRLSETLLAQGTCVALATATLFSARPFLRHLWQERRRTVLLIPLLAAVALVAALFATVSDEVSPRLVLGLLALAQAWLLALLLARQQSTAEILHSFYDRPSRLIVASFAGVILVGTLFLTFPAAAATEPIGLVDALFTATSATCVTGLIVLDTPHDFSPFGQVVLLLLIQIGGLGTMVVSTFATLLLGGRLGLKGEHALVEVLDLQAGAVANRLIRFIVLFTLGLELLGAVGLTLCFAGTGMGAAEATWRGVFHSISAFCNAGFALQSDSVILFRESTPALLLLAFLIIAGGLGFVVLAGLGARLGDHVGVRAGNQRLPVQARVVLAVSAVLLTAGTVIYAVDEWYLTLGDLGIGHKLVNAFFQSATLRTAGFNSVDLAALAPATAFFMMIFMFVGASPGSTGGGIKTTTVAVLLAAIRSTARGRPASLFGREIPRDVVARSLAIVVISAATVSLGAFLLLVLEPLPFEHLLFETVSAFGTVGLSLGVTPQLGPASKLVVAVLMFVGRTGPLTLALFLGSAPRGEPAYRRPESRLMVG